MKPLRFGLLALIFAIALPARADQLQIAVAANFLGTLQKLAPEFEKASGHKLLLSGGASGQFYSQIRQGAPFDIFLSADAERPQKLEQEGLAVSGSRFTYAIGRVALWSPRKGYFEDGGVFLKQGGYRFVAIANPKLAPYGAAAQQVLEHLGVWKGLSDNGQLVTGESSAQTLQYITTGNAELGFVAWAQLVGDKEKALSGSLWLPPQDLYDPIVQDAVILQNTKRRAAAEQFMKWLRSDPRALLLIRESGYSVDGRR